MRRPAHVALVFLSLAACEGSVVLGVGSGGAHRPLASPRAPLAADAEPCPPEMAHVEQFCVDRWEAYVVEIDALGRERPHSPYVAIGNLNVRAKSAPGVVPQGYASMLDGQRACNAAGKRLCKIPEYVRACRGPDSSAWYPYGGRQYVHGNCNEGKFSAVTVMFGPYPWAWTYAQFNDPRLNQMTNGLAPTGMHPRCESPEGVFDMVGNLHEWVDEPEDRRHHGRFLGGSYGDAEINGHGCLYVTSAHELAYHDYSTGFRCCRDARE